MVQNKLMASGDEDAAKDLFDDPDSYDGYESPFSPIGDGSPVHNDALDEDFSSPDSNNISQD